MTAGVALGLNESDLSNALQNAQLEIGKIDFKGLSQEEVAERLNQAISESLSGVIDGVEEFTALIGDYGKANEEALETLGRLAVEYEQASFALKNIGKTITSTTEALNFVEATGGLQNFSDAMGSFVNGFYTEEDQDFCIFFTILSEYSRLCLN
jgi:hypothetical protein